MSNKTCPISGKVQYESKILAYTALEKIMRKKQNKYILNTVYKCPDCNCYHLTKVK